jgi:hypothetical protein
MAHSKISQLVLQLENFLECWKQFNHYLNLGRSKKYGQEDENQFLEIKSVITQELEMILASVECGSISKEEIHGVLGGAPSIRFLTELNEGSLRGLENQWHKIFIAWQSVLGQLKVQQRQAASKSVLGSLFGRK